MNVRSILLVFGGILFIVFAVLIGANFTKQALHHYEQGRGAKVVLAQLDALRANDIDAAYAYASRQFHHATTHSEFSRFADRYGIFRNNIASKIKSATIVDNMGSIKIELTDKDHLITKLDYDIIKEEGDWKIIHLQITSPMAATNFGEILADKFDKKPPELIKSFDNSLNRYSIKYPARWNYENLSNGTVIFSGMKGTRAYYSTINIQTILTKKSGGHFKSVQQLMSDIKKQVATMTKNPIYLESGPFSMIEKNGNKANGEYMIFTYDYNGYTYQQWDVIVSRNDGQVFYVWAYTSPSVQYNSDLPLAEAILSSWQIY